MKNIVGQTPRGDDFFPREKIINRIYRRLESGNHLYLSAPRRSGKTSIMRFLEDNPKEDYVFIYQNVEDSNDIEDYFRLLTEELEHSAARGRFSKLKGNTKSAFDTFFDRVKKIKIAGFELETDDVEKTTYRESFEKLLRDLETENTTIVIMVDEFPVAVENIAKKHGKEEAIHFLHINRGMRQRAETFIRFVYTGSIGLPNVARNLDPAPTINDLNIVEIPALTMEEGMDMSKKIFSTYGITVGDDVLLYMLERVEWLMPFFIQLTIQLLIDESESINEAISMEMVDKVLLKAANHRNNIYFGSYLDRLSKTLPKEHCETAKSILAEIANKGKLARIKITQGNAQLVLETLEYDGYIHEQEGYFRFNSPILRLWWQKNASGQ